MRPKVHYARPAHPPPDPPIPEASALGHETRHSMFTPHCLAQAELEYTKQRHSFPDRLVRSRSSDIVCPGRRPTSDPGLNRRVAVEERDPAGAFALGPSSSPSKDSLKGEVTNSCWAVHFSVTWNKIGFRNYNYRNGNCCLSLTLINFISKAEDRKDSDDEKSDRNRPWWKKRFVSAIPKGQSTNHLLILSMSSFLNWKMYFCTLKSDLFDCSTPLFFLVAKVLLITTDRKYHTLKSRAKANL